MNACCRRVVASAVKAGCEEVEVCLGCGKPTADDDCGCPAGTAQRLVNRRAEQAEARVAKLEEALNKAKARAEFQSAEPPHDRCRPGGTMTKIVFSERAFTRAVWWAWVFGVVIGLFVGTGIAMAILEGR